MNSSNIQHVIDFIDDLTHEIVIDKPVGWETTVEALELVIAELEISK